MEKVCYILGAGLSAMAGLPVMSNFIYRAKDLYYDNQYAERIDTKLFGYVFEKINELSKIKTYCNSDLLNIEEVLSIFDMDSTFRSTRGAGDFKRFIADVIACYTISPASLHFHKQVGWPRNPFGHQKELDLLGSFFASLTGVQLSHTEGSQFYQRSFAEAKAKYSIVSLNYDTLPELFLGHLNSYFDKGPVFEFNKDSFDKSWDRPMLVKLHGDVSDNSIIPPTWSKRISREMKSKWEIAFNIISDSTQIRFLGYSLPTSDSYFQYFLKSAINSSRNLKRIDSIAIDSDSRTEERYRSLFQFKDFRFFNDKLENYLAGLGEKWEHFQPEVVDFNKLENVHLEYVRSMNRTG